MPSRWLPASSRPRLGAWRCSLTHEHATRCRSAWDWDGIPVHGQLDLLYQEGAAGRWCVVDFKTDRVTAGREAEVGAPYLVQIGLYAKALEAAVGVRPRAGLLFLSSGVYYEPVWDEVDAALTAARREIDAGLLLDPAVSEYLEDGAP